LSVTVSSSATVASNYTVNVTNGNGGKASKPSGFAVNTSLVFGGIGTVATATSNTTVTVNYPAGTQTNDVLGLVEENQGGSAITTPTGWVSLGTQSTSGPESLTVWYKQALAGETSVPLMITTTSAGASAWVVRYDRPGGTGPVVIAGTPTNGHTTTPGTTLSPTSILTSASNATEISFVGMSGANTLSLSTPQTFTQEVATTSTIGSGSALGIDDQSVPTLGTTPTAPIWSDLSSNTWAWFTLAAS
jgi:hypothetical protein